MMIVTIKKYGLRYEIEAMRTNELQITSKESINALESPISRLLRSFENLLTIFPLGVESKQLILAFRIYFIIALWMLLLISLRKITTSPRFSRIAIKYAPTMIPKSRKVSSISEWCPSADQNIPKVFVKTTQTNSPAINANNAMGIKNFNVEKLKQSE